MRILRLQNGWVSSQTLYAKRGTIYDRNGTVLVSSIECKNVYLNPSLIKKKQRRRAKTKQAEAAPDTKETP